MEKRGRGRPRIDNEIKAINQLYALCRQSAKERNLEFSLSWEQYAELIQQPCYYDGSERLGVYTDPYTGFVYRYNGIDRLDSSKGYIEGNIVTCCKICNMAKSEMTEEEFDAWLFDTGNKRKKKRVGDGSSGQLDKSTLRSLGHLTLGDMDGTKDK